METSIKNKNISSKHLQSLEIIADIWGGKNTELHYDTPFQLLCAVILSAQATDKQVNTVTPNFFAKVRESRDVESLTQEELEYFFRKINYFRNKSAFIKKSAAILTKKFDGIIPNDLVALQTLPGVGIKTAKVVLSILYQQAYVAVDTHVHRVVNRIGIVHTKTPNQTDVLLDEMLPSSIKRIIHHPLVLFGRYHCIARNPKCSTCPIAKNCNNAKNRFPEP